MCCFFFQAEDGIRDLVRSRGLGDVYKRQIDSKHLTAIEEEIIEEAQKDEMVDQLFLNKNSH